MKQRKNGFVWAALFLVLATLTALFLMPAKSWAFSLSINTPRLEIYSGPGKYSSDIVVRNTSTKDMYISVYAQDWSVDEAGNKLFMPPGTFPLSCARWITVAPTRFLLKPEESKSVTVTLQVPEKVAGGHYAVVFFEGEYPQKLGENKGTVSIGIIGRLGCMIYHYAKGNYIAKGEITKFENTPPDDNSQLDIKFKLKNEGNVFLKGKGTLLIMNEKGSLVGRQETQDVYAMPDQEVAREFSFLGELPEGAYKMVLTLDFGEGKPAAVAEKKLAVVRDGQIAKVTIDQTAGGKDKVYVKVANTGNISFNQVYATAEFISASGKSVKVLELAPVNLLPHEEKVLSDVVKLPAGSYTVKVKADFDGLTKETTIELKQK